MSTALSGSVDDTLARLLAWSRRAPRGLARVEFYSEFARVRVVDGLRRSLDLADTAFHEIDLPASTDAAHLVHTLVDQLTSLAPGVVSVAGFATALPDKHSLVDSLRVFNFNRENIAQPHLRQIWWIPGDFTQEFIRAVPDLNSWFLVRLHLTEVVRSEAPGSSLLEIQGRSPTSIEDARRQAHRLVARFRKELQQGTSADVLRRSFITPAVDGLRRAGAEKDARELHDVLQRQLLESAGGGYVPKVFISYSHDSPEHAARVLELSDRLRAEGIDAILDQYESSPPEGWPRWMDRNIRDADFVLMVCTETYYRRVMGEEEPGTGRGVRWEGKLIYQHIYGADTANHRFIPVVFEPADQQHIPVPLADATHYRLDTADGYEALYRRLTDQPAVERPALGNRKALPPRKPRQDFFAPPCNLPPRNPFFTGRNEIISGIRDRLVEDHAAAISQTEAICGLGGVGKTQTAVEYAYQYRDQYRAVFWVRADDESALNSGFVEIARVLDLPQASAQDQSEAVAAARRWLESDAGWLLIFDNADRPERLGPYLPGGGKGHVLVTSRARVFDTLGITRPTSLEELPADEAVEFLLRRTGCQDADAAQRDAAAEVARELGYLPLALEQAGAFILAGNVQFQDYLTSYRRRRLELLDESPPKMGDYGESVATTWSMNFDQVQQASEASADLLRASAFFSPDDIPLELITEGASQLGPALSAALADVDDDPVVLSGLLEPLTRYSLIDHDLDARTYKIHRLVQEVLQDGLDAGARRLWAERSMLAVSAAFPEVEFESWPRCERLLPQARGAATIVADFQLASPDAGRLLTVTAQYLYQRAEYIEAEPLYSRSLDIIEKSLGPHHHNVAVTLNNLATLFRAQGRYAEVEPLYRRALDIGEKSFGPDHRHVATMLNNLADLYRDQGKYAEADPLYRRALHISEKSLGPDHPDVATTLSNVGELYRAQRKYAEAESLFRRALDISEKSLGPDHPSMATTLSNLALLYRDQGKFAKAEPLFRQAMDIKKRSLGSDHPSIATTLNNLAGLYWSQRKYAEAEPLFRRALDIMEKSVGSDHPDLVTMLANYAVLLRATQRETEAAEMEARAAAIRQRHAEENPG